jgi:hypothetical protein
MAGACVCRDAGRYPETAEALPPGPSGPAATGAPSHPAVDALRVEGDTLASLISRAGASEAELLLPVVAEARRRARAVLEGEAGEESREVGEEPPKRSRISLPPPRNAVD